MTVIRSAEAPTFEVPGVRFTGFASPSRGCAELCTWHITVEPKLVSPASHRVDRDEVFMVTSGRVRITPSGPVVEAGDAVVVPAGTPIRLENPADVPAQLFVAIRSGFTATAEDGTLIGTPPWAQ
jgi:mannose-6-phosphate isomerase-like protein (cupin superfamily)